MDEILLSQLGDFQLWKNSSTNPAGYNLLDYLACVGTPDHFFGYIALLWPELVVHRGDHFIASHFSEKLYDEWIAQLGDAVLVQKVLNHIHISTFFQESLVPDEVAVEAAHQVARFWRQVFTELGLTSAATGAGLADATVTLFRS